MTDENRESEKARKEKDAVTAMRNARSNMALALGRIGSLEDELDRAKMALEFARNHISPSCHGYDSKKKTVDIIADAMVRISNILSE